MKLLIDTYVFYQQSYLVDGSMNSFNQEILCVELWMLAKVIKILLFLMCFLVIRMNRVIQFEM